MQDTDGARSTILQQLKALGVRWRIDDFGTGYSSLRYLQRFPIDMLKIDKSFVDGVTTSAEGHAVVAAITQLGQTLHLEVVAEGLESADQVEALGRLSLPAGPGVPLRPAAARRPGRRHAGRRRPVGRGPAARLTGGQAGQLIRSPLPSGGGPAAGEHDGDVGDGGLLQVRRQPEGRARGRWRRSSPPPGSSATTRSPRCRW